MHKFLSKLVAFLSYKTRLKVFFEMADNKAKMPFLVYSVISQNNLIGINAINHTKKLLIQIDIYAKDIKEALFYSEILESSFCEFIYKPYSLDMQGPSREDGYARVIIEAEFVL